MIIGRPAGVHRDGRRTEDMGDSAWAIGRFPCDESNQPFGSALLTDMLEHAWDL